MIKIELLGNISNARIIYIDKNNKETTLLDKANIYGSYLIVPTALNSYLNGGILKIYDGDELLKELTIQYEGCL